MALPRKLSGGTDITQKALTELASHVNYDELRSLAGHFNFNRTQQQQIINKERSNRTQILDEWYERTEDFTWDYLLSEVKIWQKKGYVNRKALKELDELMHSEALLRDKALVASENMRRTRTDGENMPCDLTAKPGGATDGTDGNTASVAPSGTDGEEIMKVSTDLSSEDILRKTTKRKLKHKRKHKSNKHAKGDTREVNTGNLYPGSVQPSTPEIEKILENNYKKNKVRKNINLQLQSTCETGLCWWDWTQFTVMPSSGQVVVYGISSEGAAPAVYVYKRLQQRKLIDPGCKHHQLSLSPVCVPKERLAISCPNCDEIRLIDLTTIATEVVTKQEGIYPSLVCDGDPGFLYAVQNVVGRGAPIMKIDCNNRFTVVKRINTRMAKYHSMYFNHRNQFISISNWDPDCMVHTVQSDTGKKMWETRWDNKGDKPFRPHGLTYSKEHHALLVAGGLSSRIAVLNPWDGSILQNIQLDLGLIAQIGVQDQDLVVFHRQGREELISYLSIL